MAIALVGSLGTVATGTTSVSPGFGQATTAGNLLVAWLGGRTGTNTISTTATGWVLVSSGSNTSAQVWCRPNCDAGETAPVFSCTLGVTMNAALGEFSGVATSSPTDQVGNNTVVGSTPLVCANAAADATSGELFMSSMSDNLTKAGTCTTSETYNNGTAAGNLNNDATSTVDHYRFAYCITTANASADQTSHADNSMNLQSIIGVTASFKIAPATPRIPRGIVNFQNPGVL